MISNDWRLPEVIAIKLRGGKFVLSELLPSHAIHTFWPRNMILLTHDDECVLSNQVDVLRWMMNVLSSNQDDVLRWMMNVFGRGGRVGCGV